jgi:cephalosporin-C deacetylase-like acetyl esterase
MTQAQPDFGAFWDALERELAVAPADPRLERDSFYSQPEWDIFRMYYSGLESCGLFAWLSIPNHPKAETLPALLRMPDYASVHDIAYTRLRHTAVVMNPSYRGQRHSDASFQARYPGLLTEGIAHHEAFVMGRVFADGLRAVDALLGQTEVAIGPLALTGAGLGGSLALAAAARRPRVSAVAADTPLALGHSDALKAGLAYPLAELNDYLRMYPQHRDGLLANSSPMDPVKVAPGVGAPVLLSLGRRDRGLCPLSVGEELAARLPRCDVRIYDGASEGGGHEHSEVRVRWLEEQLGIV